MVISKNDVRENFSKSASTYSRFAVVQGKMAVDLISHIKGLNCTFDNILEIGCGTGYLTALLADAFPQSKIVALDISDGMVAVAKENLKQYRTVEHVVADGEDPPISGSFDLVVSNAVFQWFSNWVEPFSRYNQLLEPGGYLVFNALGKKTLQELRFCLSELKSTCGGQTTPINLYGCSYAAEALGAAGFIDIEVHDSVKKEFYGSARRFLMAIKNTGAHGFSGDRALSSSLAGEVFKLIKIYNKNYSHDKRVFASFHCIIGSGCKAGKPRKSIARPKV